MKASDILGPDGLLARRIYGYEYRPQQIDMAELVGKAIDEHCPAVVEAGTGVGKSLAYLVPALLSGEHVVVSTANKTLQAQLIEKDLPLLEEVIPNGFSFCVAKGKGNYVCLAKVDAETPEVVRDFAATSETGDIDDAPMSWPKEWYRYCVGDVCHRKQCKHYEACFYYRAKARRRMADVIVCNHALLCQHLLHGDAGLLANDAKILVVDEAHQLESYAVNAQSVELTARSFAGPAEPLAPIGAAFLAALADGAQGRDEDATIPPDRHFQLGEELAESILSIDVREAMARDDEMFDLLNGSDDDDQAAYEAMMERLGSLAIRVRALARPTERGYVRHVQRHSNGEHHSNGDGGRGTVAAVTVFDVSRFLTGLGEQFSTTVYTSATLSTGDDFSYFMARNGVDPERALTLQLGSPFDYRNQCLLYLPASMPEPDWQHRDLFDEAAREQMRQLIVASGGGAMCLFTSYYAMNAAADYLSRSLPYEVKRQGELPKAMLIEWMRGRDDGVLCATASFWEGVDIQGDALRLVVIDKIPFAPPSPVEQARQAEAGKRAFLELTAPEACLRLKQGFGRLIRSSSDVGCVALLDPRLWLKGYGRKMIYALPDALVVRSVREVARFFEGREGRTEPREAVYEGVF